MFKVPIWNLKAWPAYQRQRRQPALPREAEETISDQIAPRLRGFFGMSVLRCFQWNRFSHSGSSDGFAPALALGRLGDPSEPSLAPQRVEPPAPDSSHPAPIPPNPHQTLPGASG